MSKLPVGRPVVPNGEEKRRARCFAIPGPSFLRALATAHLNHHASFQFRPNKAAYIYLFTKLSLRFFTLITLEILRNFWLRLDRLMPALRLTGKNYLKVGMEWYKNTLQSRYLNINKQELSTFNF